MNLWERIFEVLSNERSPNRVLAPLKGTSKIRSQTFIRPPPNLRLESINFARWLQKIVARCDAMCWFSGMLWSFVTTLCSPNEDFGLPNERLGTHFRSSFQRREYSIWATFLRKVLRKCVPKCSFGLPKSSFGEHKFVKRRVCQNGGGVAHGWISVT
jgi:hypothetical protein